MAPIDEFDAPDNLKTDERLVWLRLAPFAFQNRTLTKATALMFERLCRYVVLEQQMQDSVLDRGSANHRGLIQRVDAELLRFNLSPNGKPIYEEAKTAPVSKLSRFMNG